MGRSRGLHKDRLTVSDRAVSAILVTPGHMLKCKILVRGQRVLDILNDGGSEYLRVCDVLVFRKDGTRCSFQPQEAVIPKANIHLAILSGSKHEAPEKRAVAFSSKDQYEALATVDQYEIHGRIHMKGHPDGTSFLTREASRFVPITQARVCHPGAQESDARPRLVLVQTRAIDMLHVSTKEVAVDDLLLSIRQLVERETSSHSRNDQPNPAFPQTASFDPPGA